MSFLINLKNPDRIIITVFFMVLQKLARTKLTTKVEKLD
jgi:hypothetical protein